MADSARTIDALFQPERLSLGLGLPLVARGQRHVDDARQLEYARQADARGFAALWVRDVPLHHADYPDPVAHLDPWAFLGALAARTRRIALASGAIVLTLRHPLHVAKGAVSLARLSQGRFVLGLGSGDRPPEYAAFGRQGDQRRELYRRHWEQLAAALAVPPRVIPDREDEPPVAFELLPRPPAPVPMLAIGSDGQSLDWIARHAAGWITYHREPAVQRDRHRLWREAVRRAAPGAFRAFGVAMRVDLLPRRDAPATPIELGYRTGMHGLRGILERMREDGTHHVALNLSDGDVPAAEAIDALADDLLPALRP